MFSFTVTKGNQSVFQSAIYTDSRSAAQDAIQAAANKLGCVDVKPTHRVNLVKEGAVVGTLTPPANYAPAWGEQGHTCAHCSKVTTGKGYHVRVGKAYYCDKGCLRGAWIAQNAQAIMKACGIQEAQGVDPLFKGITL